MGHIFQYIGPIKTLVIMTCLYFYCQLLVTWLVLTRRRTAQSMDIFCTGDCVSYSSSLFLYLVLFSAVMLDVSQSADPKSKKNVELVSIILLIM